MTLLAPLLALFSCKRATEERKATEAFAIQSLLTYEYCGEKDGFQYFLLGNQWGRKVFKIKSSEIHIDPQYAFYADPSFEPKIPICLRTILYRVISLVAPTYTRREIPIPPTYMMR